MKHNMCICMYKSQKIVLDEKIIADPVLTTSQDFWIHKISIYVKYILIKFLARLTNLHTGNEFH
jgi:hypothetical protein